MGVQIAAAAVDVAAALERLVAVAVIAAVVLAKSFAVAAPAVAAAPPMGSVPDQRWQLRSDHDPVRRCSSFAHVRATTVAS